MRNERQGDMTQGNPLPLMVKFAIPMLIGGIFQLLYNMVDTVVLGRYVGVSALASIGVTGTTVFGIVQGGCAVMNAISVVAAQCFGSGDDDRLKMVVGNSIWLVLITGAVLGAVGFWGARPIMQLIGTPDDIIDGAVLYLQITCGLVIIQLLYNAVAALLRAIGDSRTPLIFLIVCSLLNVALDLIFVINFKMEIAGVAIATIISQAVSAVLAIAYMLKKYAERMFRVLFCYFTAVMRPFSTVTSHASCAAFPGSACTASASTVICWYTAAPVGETEVSIRIGSQSTVVLCSGSTGSA